MRKVPTKNWRDTLLSPFCLCTSYCYLFNSSSHREPIKERIRLNLYAYFCPLCTNIQLIISRPVPSPHSIVSGNIEERQSQRVHSWIGIRQLSDVNILAANSGITEAKIHALSISGIILAVKAYTYYVEKTKYLLPILLNLVKMVKYFNTHNYVQLARSLMARFSKWTSLIGDM